MKPGVGEMVTARPLRRTTVSLVEQGLRDSVMRQLAWDPDVDATMIAVSANDGIVTLSGSVPTYAARTAKEIDMRVRDIMTQPMQTCRLETDLGAASRRMHEMGCGALGVLDEQGRLAGILTDRDLAMAIGNARRNAAYIAAQDAMTRQVYTCTADDTVRTVLDRMAARKIRRLPVVDARGAVVGMVSIDDIILWSVHKGGIGAGELAAALRSICAPRTLVSEPDLPDL